MRFSFCFLNTICYGAVTKKNKTVIKKETVKRFPSYNNKTIDKE